MEQLYLGSSIHIEYDSIPDHLRQELENAIIKLKGRKMIAAKSSLKVGASKGNSGPKLRERCHEQDECD
jgi:hypothetical protein